MRAAHNVETASALFPLITFKMDSQQTLTLLSQPKASPDTNGIPSVQVHSEDPAESRGRRMDSHRDGTATLKPPEPARGSSRSRSPLGRVVNFMSTP